MFFLKVKHDEQQKKVLSGYTLVCVSEGSLTLVIPGKEQCVHVFVHFWDKISLKNKEKQCQVKNQKKAELPTLWRVFYTYII